MIRLLWLFLILDVAISTLFALAWFIGVPTAGASLHDTSVRVLFEIAVLAIIEAVRERKV
ncbi:hypothetical protein D3C85_883000 [compost metagenome]